MLTSSLHPAWVFQQEQAEFAWPHTSFPLSFVPHASFALAFVVFEAESVAAVFSKLELLSPQGFSPPPLAFELLAPLQKLTADARCQTFDRCKPLSCQPYPYSFAHPRTASYPEEASLRTSLSFCDHSCPSWRSVWSSLLRKQGLPGLLCILRSGRERCCLAGIDRRTSR